MKTILCYGDSLTWGYHPETGERIAINERWTGVLRNNLGNNYYIIEEGLNGRTTVWDDPLHGGYKNGMNYLLPCLSSHKPIEIVILFLGTNDLKNRFSLSASEIAQGIRVLINIILKSETGPNKNSPQILLISPPHIRELTNTKLCNFKDEFDGGELKSLQLSQYYKQVAEEFGILFFDASNAVKPSKSDGIHLDSNEHIKLGLKISKIVKGSLK